MFDDTAFRPPQMPSTTGIFYSHAKTVPSDQNAIDIFAGEWASKFPPPFDDLKAGEIPLFQDTRLAWAIDRLGGVRGQTVLELGPLEGGHGYMLEQAGAGFITSIESNTRAYLKCLVAKQILGLVRTRYWCGDFIPFLETTSARFDLVIASGVLYHMQDPLRLLRLVSRCSNRLYLWTHYYDESIIEVTSYLKPRFGPRAMVSLGDQQLTLHRQQYQAELLQNNYFGGSESHSNWLTRDGILAVLRFHGFQNFEFNFEDPYHPHGPAFSVIASKDA